LVRGSIDTLRADHLGLYGYQRDTSPFLDRFAKASLVCEHAWSPCPWTLVAHMTMLTGLFPDQHGVTTGQRALADEIPLLAERLHAAGYQTIGLYHPVWINARHGFQRGFDVFRAHGEADEAEVHLQEELAKLDRSRPFFLFLHLFDVHQGPIRENQHSIYPSPAPFQEMFEPGATEKLPLVSWKLDPKSSEQREAMAALYDGGIRYVDSKLEQWFGDLEHRGLLANTLVIVTADHGENLMDRGRITGHGRFWNEGIHVPLIVRHPRGLGAGTRVKENVHLGDIVPTVLDVLGLPADPRLPGRSLFTALPPERVIIGSQDIGDYALLGTRKLARGQKRFLSLDLATDPQEKKGKVLDECPEFAEWTARATDPTVHFAPSHEVEPFTPEEAEHLRALGYAGEVDDPGKAEEADDR
jgi:arylsulfatase A-like enzyme